MKVQSSKRLRQRGSILAVTLILSILLGMTLGSYLYWVRTQNVLVTESQAWNYAIALAEAGIEEGMAQINVSVGTPNPLNYFPSVLSAANGWSGSGTGPFSKTNSPLGYFVTISNDYPPTIYSTATTSVPLIGKT